MQVRAQAQESSSKDEGKWRGKTLMEDKVKDVRKRIILPT